MNGFFNTVSNGPYGDNTVNSIMANGDTVVLAIGSYKCSEGSCADSPSMLYTYALNGVILCHEDDASCILDAERTRQGMKVQDTDGDTLLLRAISFKDGEAPSGAGISILEGAIVDIELCVFSNCRSTTVCFGCGGAIYVLNIGTTVNIYGTGFNGNTAVSGNGADIYNGSGDNLIIIHNTCPSPYSSNTPTQGEKNTIA
jgi:hypothetical protein